MNERLNELEGSIEKQYGKLRNDSQMQATGEEDAAAARLERKVEGTIEEAEGALEEYLGASQAYPLITADGEARRAAGSLKKAG